MKQFDACESSLSQATLFTNSYTESLVQGIYSILEELSHLEKQQEAPTPPNNPHLVGNIFANKARAKTVESFEEL